MSPERPAAKPNPIRLRAVPTERIEPHLVAPARSGNLPRPLTSLIGRDAEIASVLALLADDDVRLLTLTGPGGVGKTRLAISVAEDAAATFAEGVVFVALAPITDPELILPAIAHALGLREIGAHPLLEQITAYLGPRELLLILDNFEHHLPAATVITDLLAGCPRLTVFVTSRSVLRLSGEHDFPVPPLPLPDAAGTTAQRCDSKTVSLGIECAEAVQLFVERARAARPGFTLTTDNADAVAEICRRLDGLPLAIELAATRLRALPPQALVTRLEQRFSLLSGGPQDAPARHRTMRAAIAWSYDLLSPAEQALFRRLAVFVGGCTLEAAEAVGGDGPTVFDLVSTLLEHSLLHRVEPPDGETPPSSGGGLGGEPRYTMLETVREYGLEQLAISGEDAAAREAHAAYFLQLAERAEPNLLAGDKAAWVCRLTAELPNLRAAFGWWRDRSDAERALRLAGSLGLFWTGPSFIQEGRAWLEAAVALPEVDRAPAPLAKALNAIGVVAQWQCDFARVEEALTAALVIRQELNDQLGVAEVLGNLGHVALATGELDRADALLTQSLPVYERHGKTVWVAENLAILGHVANARGDYDRSADYYEQALAISRRLPGEPKVNNALIHLGWMRLLRGDLARSRSAYAEGFALVRSQGDAMRLGRCVRGAAGLAATEGNPRRAARLFAASAAQRDREEIALQPVIQADHDRLTAKVRAALGEASFAAAWRDGYALPLAAAVEEAAVVFAGPTQEDGSELPGPEERLTPREREILRLLVDGKPDKEIAAALSIGRRTVSNHVATIRGKLDAPSRSAAAAIAMRDHLV